MKIFQYSSIGYKVSWTLLVCERVVFCCVVGDRLEPLYAPIRHKLSNALTNWHPSDPSAKMILQPWVKVFQQGHMDAFIVKNIVPKLGMCMAEFVINPHQQHLGKASPNGPQSMVVRELDLNPAVSHGPLALKYQWSMK